MVKRYRRTSAPQYLFIALIGISLVALVFLSSYIMQRMRFTDHFVLPWAAGRMWLLEGVSPYDEAVIALAEDTIDNSSFLGELSDSRTLIEPVINLIFYLPFSLIPYEISRAIWVTLLFTASGLMGYLSLKLSGWELTLFERITVLLLVILWMPGIDAVIKGLLSPIIILLMLLSIYLIMQGHDTMAGFVLALTFGSFPTTGLIITLLIIWSITRRRWSILKAYLSGVAFLLAVTLLLLPSWPMNWLRVVYDLYGYGEWIRTPLMNVAGLLPGIANYLSIFLHASFAIYLLVLWITLLGKKGDEFIWKVLTTLVIAYFFHVSVNTYQLSLLLPAMFMIFRFWSERWGRFGCIFSWILLMTISTTSWLLVRTGISFDAEQSLPLMTIGLPVFVFIGMIWIRWWALRISRLPFER
jgi:hypothetical protein